MMNSKRLAIAGLPTLMSPPRVAAVAAALSLTFSPLPVQASLDDYDREIARDREAGLSPTAVLTRAVTFDGRTAFPFDYGPVNGSATVEFIASGDPAAGGDSGFLGVGTNATWNLRFEQWNDTAQLGFTHLGTADYRFTPAVASPTQPTHVAFRYEAETGVMQVFLDGEPAGSATAPDFEMPTGWGWLGARRADLGAEGMVGVIERVTVYSTAIPPEAVRRHANAWRTPPSRLIEIDSDLGAIRVNGEVQSDGRFGGVPFTATTYNGRTRFLFAGDLIFAEGDVVRGQGTQAISLTASGDVHIPESVVIDVSAAIETPGPGGGAGGGVASGGDGGVGGNPGSGGGGGEGGDRGRVQIGIPDRLYSPTGGSSGSPGKTDATDGAAGKRASGARMARAGTGRPTRAAGAPRPRTRTRAGGAARARSCMRPAVVAAPRALRGRRKAEPGRPPPFRAGRAAPPCRRNPGNGAGRAASFEDRRRSPAAAVAREGREDSVGAAVAVVEAARVAAAVAAVAATTSRPAITARRGSGEATAAVAASAGQGAPGARVGQAGARSRL
jgi:hypothetical protein